MLDFFGGGLIGSSEPPTWVLGNELGSPANAALIISQAVLTSPCWFILSQFPNMTLPQ